MRALNRLPSARGIRSCPADTGTSITAFFRYPSLDDVPVTVQLTGCATATNGHIKRTPSNRSAHAATRNLKRLT